MGTRHWLLAATLLAGGVGAAVDQNAASNVAAYHPAQLPGIQGKVAVDSLTPRGDVDGLTLADGAKAHLPPHLGTQLVYAVKPGDAVTIDGPKAHAIAIVQAMSIKNDAGSMVTDTGAGGPPGPHDAR